MDDFILDLDNYKEYDRVEAEYNGYTGAIYKDNMFGMEFGNVSVYNPEGQEIFHATLDATKKYTKDNVIQYIQSSIKIIKLVKEDK